MHPVGCSHTHTHTHVHTHTHTHTQSLIRGKRMLLPQNFKVCPNREKICNVFVGKRY